MEIAAPWSRLADLFDAVREALIAVAHARVASCHLSHSYPDGACLYFTFAATPPADEIESTYVALWDAGQRAVLANGGNLSHHHGVGLNRARFIGEALGAAHGVLVAVKAALDPDGILNPGKLGLPSPFGGPPWPLKPIAQRTGTGTPSAPGRWSPSCSPCRSRSPDGGPPTAATTRRSAVWLNLGAVVGFVLGAGCAAWVQRVGFPLSHGLVTAVGTYLAAQAVFIVVRLVRGLDVRWFAVVFNLTVVLARRAARRPARPAPAQPRESLPGSRT